MNDTIISNYTFEELSVGQSASMSHTVTPEDIKLFAAVSKDTNPAHLDADYAAGTMFKEVIMHGMWSAGLISAVIGTKLPGVGTIYLGQDLQFRHPVYIGDTISATLTVTEKNPEKQWVTMQTVVTNQNGDKVVVGTANVMAPKQKVKRKAIAVPKVSLSA